MLIWLLAIKDRLSWNPNNLSLYVTAQQNMAVYHVIHRLLDVGMQR